MPESIVSDAKHSVNPGVHSYESSSTVQKPVLNAGLEPESFGEVLLVPCIPELQWGNPSDSADPYTQQVCPGGPSPSPALT